MRGYIPCGYMDRWGWVWGLGLSEVLQQGNVWGVYCLKDWFKASGTPGSRVGIRPCCWRDRNRMPVAEAVAVTLAPVERLNMDKRSTYEQLVGFAASMICLIMHRV